MLFTCIEFTILCILSSGSLYSRGIFLILLLIKHCINGIVNEEKLLRFSILKLVISMHNRSKKLKMSDYALIMHGFDFRKSYDC